MTLRDGAETMSLDGRSGGTVLAGLSERERRTVMYPVGFPNLLISLHPDYVMTHRLTPLAVDARGSNAPGRSPARSIRPTPSTSGISRTGRTGPPASRCSAGFARRTPYPDHSPPPRTGCTSSCSEWPGPTCASCSARRLCRPDRANRCADRGSRPARRG
jgi:hypothetical protein